jgi:hypothetical protein
MDGFKKREVKFSLSVKIQTVHIIIIIIIHYYYYHLG